jgi:adenylate cyclase
VRTCHLREFASLGREALTAVESGEAALAVTAADNFDLVLLDMMMPGLSGFEVLCRLKADARTRHLPIIMISALDEFDSTVRCIAAGAEDYLPKPFNPVVLRAGVGASLRRNGCSTNCASKRSVRKHCS